MSKRKKRSASEFVHTPTPWKMSGTRITGKDGTSVVDLYGAMGGDDNDAAFIVKAVNCHEALIRVMNEAKHYASTGKGKQFLLEAIAKAEAL